MGKHSNLSRLMQLSFIFAHENSEIDVSDEDYPSSNYSNLCSTSLVVSLSSLFSSKVDSERERAGDYTAQPWIWHPSPPFTFY